MSSVREITEACNKLLHDSENYLNKSPMLIDKCKYVAKAVESMNDAMESAIDDTYERRVAESKKACELEGLQLEQLLASKHSGTRTKYKQRCLVVEAHKTLEKAIAKIPKTAPTYVDAFVELKFVLDTFVNARQLVFSLEKEDEERLTKIIESYKEYLS